MWGYDEISKNDFAADFAGKLRAADHRNRIKTDW